jgi:hypothetical protein
MVQPAVLVVAVADVIRAQQGLVAQVLVDKDMLEPMLYPVL